MAELSPMMQQYINVKNENPDSILFFRVGDFYEMFFEDAETASEALDITLTGKDCGMEERAPMCGVPYHSCEAYIARLVEKGFKVAVCEQTENPAEAKGIVRREVIRTITPGTVIEDSMLDEGSNSYLAAVAVRDDGIGVCFTDASTGSCCAATLAREKSFKNLIDEISRFRPKELLISESLLNSSGELSNYFEKLFNGAVTAKADAFFDPAVSEKRLLSHFNALSTENLGLEVGSAAAAAVGAVIEYLYETGVNGNISVKKVEIYSGSRFMRLDMTAVRNLEIVETMRTKSKRGSLLWVLDKTKTAMGKRLLGSWVVQPLMSIAEIAHRQNAVEELADDTVLRGELVQSLCGIRDIERIMTRVIYGSASPRDLIGIADTAVNFPLLKGMLENAKCRMLKEIYADIDTLEDICDLIRRAVNENPPATVREGGVIKPGYSDELDSLRSDMSGSNDILAQIELRERERTGIKTLRVKYNKVFGYYIEVTNSFKDMVPEDYIRKQTLTNCERYITEELKGVETRVLTAKDKSFQLEYELFDGVRKITAAALERFQKTAAAVAALDVLCSLASVASLNRYCRPVVNNSGTIMIKSGRHPVVEQVMKTPFVANDTYLNMKEERCHIITGPNMAGKSTYMRQVAIITLMAQIGSFVPAESAEIGLVDAIFTRVGASDDLASGQSTFMVEMSEVADILKYATKNSLLILDEIGRGTATFDGMSIARAVLEYAADKRKLGAKALFATHYHEITAMENELDGVCNYNVAVKKRGDDITFLRRIVRGSADRSYGIEVAQLSGIPTGVIRRAREILKKTEEEGIVTYKTAPSEDMQLPLEMQGAIEILRELQAVDVNTLTPIEAMQLLFDICNKAKSV